MIKCLEFYLSFIIAKVRTTIRIVLNGIVFFFFICNKRKIKISMTKYLTYLQLSIRIKMTAKRIGKKRNGSKLIKVKYYFKLLIID